MAGGGALFDHGEVNDEVQGRYHDDPEFRKYVDDYLLQFNRLLAEAKETDPENILSATFLSSDVGKLYLMLTSTLGRR